MTEDHKAIENERNRVSDMLAQAVKDIEDEGGDIRMFAAALLCAGVQLHVEIEGPENLDRAISKIGQRELQRVGAASIC